MPKAKSRLNCWAIVGVFLLGCGMGLAQAGDRTRGRLFEQGGVRILELCGTNEERGYTHGFLLGEEVIQVLDTLITHAVSGGKEGYERDLIPFTKKMNMHFWHVAELHAIVRGVKDKMGREPIVPVLGRALTYEDLLAMNCIPDTAPISCSSFSTWGRMTKDHHPLGGRNFDWWNIPGLADHQLVIAQAMPEDITRVGWVGIAVPGFIGCLTGVNQWGVSVALHDVVTGKPFVESGYAPRALALRAALEGTRKDTEARDLQAILGARPSAVGNLVPAMWPLRPGSKIAPSALFEYDGHADYGERTIMGVIRDHDFLVGTNHYRIRVKDTPSCERFELLFGELARLERDAEPMDVDKAWTLLNAVAVPREAEGKLLTYHAVVVEPNAMKMHVALSKDGKPAPQGARTTLDIAGILNETAVFAPP